MLLFLFAITLTVFRIYFQNNSDQDYQNQNFEGRIIEYIWHDKYVEIEIRNQRKNYLIKFFPSKKEEFQNQIQYGYKIKGIGKKILPENNTIPNTFNYKKYLLSKKNSFYFETKEIVIEKENNLYHKIRQQIRTFLSNKKNSQYLKMLILGIQEDTKEILEIYRHNGISHIFAISGMHLSLIYLSSKKIFQKVSKKSKSQSLFAFFILSCYYFLLKKSISSDRAYYYFLLSTIVSFLNIKINAQKILMIVLSFQLLKNPFIIYQVGFWYTYLLTFTFLIIIPSKKKKWRSALEYATIAYFTSMPITIQNNFSINLWSIPINIIMLPFITTILFPLLLVSIFIFPLENFTSIIITLLEKVNIYFLNLLGTDFIFPKIPFPLLGIYYFFLFRYLIYKKRKILLNIILLILILFIYPKFDGRGYFYFIDVGQGDCNLIIAPNQKEIILIDTGNKNQWLANNLITFLKSLGIRKIDYLILTHGDLDHLGNVEALFSHFKIKNLLMNEGEKNNYEKQIIEKYSFNITNKVNLQNLKVTELKHSLAETENDNSRIFQICIYKRCTLFMGDASKKVETELLMRYKLNTTIIKIGHHGSKSSSMNAFLKHSKAKEAIISAGRNNFYHHPDQEVVRRLKKNQIKIHSTQEKGTIKIKITPFTYTFSYFPP